MDNTEKLLRAFIGKLGYEIEQSNAGHANCDCIKRNPRTRQYMLGCQKCQGTGVSHGLFDYKLIEKPKLTIAGRAQEVGATHDFGSSIL